MTGRRIAVAMAVLSVLDAGTTAWVFHVVGPSVEGNPLAAALTPLLGAYGMLAAVLLLAKLPLSAGAGAIYSRLKGRRATVFATVALLPLSLVVANNTAAVYILWRLS